MRLILVRHGETSWNCQGRIQGCRSDIELSQKGRAQAEQIAIALRREKLDAVYSSTLERARDTAQAIAQDCQLEVRLDHDLREIDAGELEGLLGKELGGQYSKFWNEWRKGSPSLHIPGGESLEELQIRAWAAIQCITRKHPDEVVAVVGHFFANLTIICQALGFDLRYMGRLRQDPAAINILELANRRNTLLLLNDTCHLEV